MRRTKSLPRVSRIRRKLGLSQKEFAAKFRIPLGSLRNWEQALNTPNPVTRTYLRLIARNPKAVIDALEPQASSPASVPSAA
jgi:putative transcriptional regulator